MASARMKIPLKNARERERVEAVANVYKELRTALGADDKRTTSLEVLKAAFQFIHDLKEELARPRLPRNEPSDGMDAVATEPSSHAVQANLVRICAPRCMLPRLLS